MEYYTLSREEIQAIAARAAELAVDQVLNGFVSTVSRPPCRYTFTTKTGAELPDARELTQYERDTLEKIFT